MLEIICYVNFLVWFSVKLGDGVIFLLFCYLLFDVILLDLTLIELVLFNNGVLGWI